MDEYKRVRVTAPPGPQMRLANAFPSEEYTPETEAETIELVANPDRVQDFIDRFGNREGWGEWIEDITVADITDPSTLPYALQGLIEEENARVWQYARELIPTDANLDDYLWHNRVSFTWSESVVDKLNAEPPTTATLETWVEDEFFQFDRRDGNPTQNPNFDDTEGPVFAWDEELSREHPEVELRVTGDLRAPQTGAPHGYAHLNGLAVTMVDGQPLTDDVIDWCKRRFWKDFNEETGSYQSGTEYIGQADEFDVYDGEGQSSPSWIRLWWD